MHFCHYHHFILCSGLPVISSVLLHGIQDSQDFHEQVDDVQIQVDGGQDIFFWRKLVHQHVGVKHNECRKQQGSGDGINKLQSFTMEEKLPGGKDDSTQSHFERSRIILHNAVSANKASPSRHILL